MKKNHLKSFAVICIALVFQGCKTRIVDFTMISTQNVPIDTEGVSFKKATQRVEGKDTKPIILWIPFTPSMKEAIDDAIRKYPGAVALSDGVVYGKSWTCLLFGQNSYVVEGTPVYADKHNQEKELQPINNTKNLVTIQNKQDLQNQENDYMRITHIVETEKNIAELAKMYDVSIPDLLKWNKISTTSLTKGQRIIVYIKM